MSNQSGIIVGAVFFAFFVYITLKGELPAYAGLLIYPPANAVKSAQAQSPSQSASASSSALTTAAQIAQGFALFAG